MNQLYPIIRRKRRPLSLPDEPTVEKSETLKAEMLKPEARNEPAPGGRATGQRPTGNVKTESHVDAPKN
jgi:hypothetical protein